MRQDCETSEGVVVASWSGGGNMGMRRYYACQLSLLFEEGGTFFVIEIK